MIGVEMFGRPVSYDTGSDSVVRVKASEVRKKLLHFYRENPEASAVRIELPSGSYLPLFIFRDEQVHNASENVAADQPTVDLAASLPPDSPEEGPRLLRRFRSSRRLRLVAAAIAIGSIAIALMMLRYGIEKRSQIRSIAILPFVNLSYASEQDYFADGMTDELITDLGQLSTLQVISRTSTMSLKGTKKLLPEIARELGVDGVVEGTVQRDGSEVRITAKLIDARHDKLLWASTYTRDRSNSLALEAELAQIIANKVNASVSPRLNSPKNRAGRISVAAEDLYLKGMQRLNADQCIEAKGFFESAINEDPQAPQAHAALAFCYGRLGENGEMNYAEAFSMQKVEAMKAIASDDSIPEGHTELANAAMNLSWDWETAAREFHRALELNPSSAVAHERYATYLERNGKFDEAITEVEKSMTLDPVSDRSFRQAMFTYYFARHYDRALELSRRALASGVLRAPDNFLLGDVYAEKGMYSKSIAAFKAEGDNAHALGHLGYAYARSGDSAGAHQVIAQLKMHVEQDGLGRYELAIIYAGLGDKENAFFWLNESYKARNEGLTNLKLDPCMDSLRSDPRFQDLARISHSVICDSGNDR